MPGAGADLPANTLSNEDLPAPDGPKMAHVSPALTLPEQDCKILFLPAGVSTSKLRLFH
jgi:hypothetical protein